MEDIIEIRVPNIGDVSNVTIKEIIKPQGTRVKKGKSVFRLDMGYGLMDVASPEFGEIQEVRVSVGDKVSKDMLLATLMVMEKFTEDDPYAQSVPSFKAESVSLATKSGEIETEIVVIGGGPGGYTAAFRAADLGKRTVLVERYPEIGGVCLNVGCIPSKALLHVAKIIDDSIEAHKFGVTIGPIKLDLEKMRKWKAGVVAQLKNGLTNLVKKRELTVVKGTATFVSPNKLEVKDNDSVHSVKFKRAIIAAGSSAIMLPGFPEDDRIVTSTGALELKEIPRRMLIIGGGVIGLEMATVYHALGSEITIVEDNKNLIPIVDPDLVKPLYNYVKDRYKQILLNTKVSKLTAEESGIKATFQGEQAVEPMAFDMVLVAVGRKPNSKELALDKAGVAVDNKGFIIVDRQQRSNVDHIFAIGDIVGEPMLAHKASYEGKIAAEVASGLRSAFEATVIPFVAYTDPEIAWVGVTEREAKEQGIPYEIAVFPWSASGRSLSMGRKEGKTKVIFDRDTNLVMGAGIVGPNASELISQVALSIEMGCEAEDISLTIHPHPTLSESLSMAAEVFEGTITDLYLPKRPQHRRN